MFSIQKSYLITYILFFLFLGCNTDVDPENSENSLIVDRGRISIRTNSDSDLEFYDKDSLETFIPAGYNYTDYRNYNWNGIDAGGHSTFNSDIFDLTEAEDMFHKLSNYGYNCVRVFLDPLKIADSSGNLDSTYISNLSSFINSADSYGIKIIITMDLIPVTMQEGDLNSIEDFTWANFQYIDQDQIDLELIFWQRFISSLQSNSVDLDSIFAYELRNEMAFDITQPPFNYDYDNPSILPSGIVTTASGNNYDISNEAEIGDLLEDSFNYWSKSVRDKIKSLDSGALVTVGYYANFNYLSSELKTPELIAISSSELDFVDLHIYPGEGKNVSDYMTHFQVDENTNKLLLLGEFGYVESNNLSISTLANNLLEWKDEIIDNYGFDGWLLWTWEMDSWTDGSSDAISLSVSEDDEFLEKLAPE